MAAARVTNQVILGLIVIGVGAVFLVDSLNIYDSGLLFRWWPSLIILVGVWRLAENRLRNVTGPLLIICSGTIVQLLVLGIDIGSLWPVLLIAIGLGILIGGPRLRRMERTIRDHEQNRGTVRAIGLFSSSEAQSEHGNFEGGQATGIFGSSDVKLSAATIQERPAVFEATALFGTVDITVPENWVVRNDAFSFFGSLRDERLVARDETHGEPDLIIKGLALFGEIKIKD